MRKRWMALGSIALAAGAAGTIGYFCMPAVETDDASESVVSEGIGASAASQGGAVRVADVAVDARPLPQDASKSAPKVSDGGVPKKLGETASTAADEVLMDEVVAGLMNMLKDAASRKDYAAMMRIAEKLRSIKYGATVGGTGKGARAVKQQLLDLAGESGASGLALAMDFLGDEDRTIAETAEQVLFKKLNDSNIPDGDRAEIVVEAAQEMTNQESIDRLFNEFVKMRHSVGASAFEQILSSGTDQAKATLPRVMQAFTGDSSITTASEVSAWVKENPDDPLDDWFYGKEDLESVKRKYQ